MIKNNPSRFPDKEIISRVESIGPVMGEYSRLKNTSQFCQASLLRVLSLRATWKQDILTAVARGLSIKYESGAIENFLSVYAEKKIR